MEKLGPVKDVLYHKTCFTCIVCHTTLSLSNFHHNHADMADLNVYCGSHKPLAKANPLDSNAVGIHRALSVPKTNRWVVAYSGSSSSRPALMLSGSEVRSCVKVEVAVLGSRP